MTDLSSMMGIETFDPESDAASTDAVDLAPDNGLPPGPAITPPIPGQSIFDGPVPSGVHPWDQSSPIGADGHPVEHDKPPTDTAPAPTARRRDKPWNLDNEQAMPVFERSAHDWSANAYTVQAANPPIQVAGRRKGCKSTVVWVPAAAALGVIISPDSGDIQQGAGITLNPGDSIELATEAAVWAGVIPGNATGTVYCVRLFNPPGGGLGLSSS